jgi:hypothetical protein
MAWVKGLVIVLVALAFIVLTLAAYGASRWGNATRELQARLDAAHQAVAPARYDAARELDGLPPPVQRFFRAALRDGQAIVDTVTIEHTGTFNLTTQGPDRWRSFTSKQRVTMRRPGLLWDARVSMLPGVAVHVHDAYIAGEGMLRVAVMGMVPPPGRSQGGTAPSGGSERSPFALADIRGTSAEPGGVAEGEFIRWFAEAAWYPTALLPSQGVRWTAVDDHTARATASDGDIDVTLEFGFDAASGLIESVRAQARGRIVGDKVELTPWEGRWSGYAERDGMKVPMQGEVAWLASGGRRAYWRGTVRTLAFTMAR